MRTHRWPVIALLFALGLIFASTAVSALPINVDFVEIDDVRLSTTNPNRLSIERDQVVDVEVKFSSTTNLDDVELEAFFSGYEYNDVEPLSDQTQVFDMDAGVDYVKRLTITLPNDVDEDDYRLRIMFTDRFDATPVIANFPIKVDVPRHRLDVEDVILTPGNTVQAGSALLATVRLENNGEKDQEDVRVTVSIPALSISGSDYLDEIEVENEEETEEMFLRVPQNAKSGRYELVVEVLYDEGHRRITKSYPVNVQGDPRYESDETGSAPKAGTVISLGSTLESAVAGETSAVYPITVVNHGKNSRTYTLRVDDADWADVRVTPTSTMIIEGGESKLFTITVAPQADAPTGAQVISATLVEGEKTLKELQLTTNVKPGANGLATLKRVLQVALVVLLVLLVIIALVLAFRRAGGNNEQAPQPETYY